MRGPESYIVTLPLTEEQGRAAVVAQHNTPPCIASELAAMVRAVGVPVGAGELEDVCALAWKLPDTVDSIIVFKTAQEARERGWPDSQITSAVLRTDAEARIAALNAENGRLREAARSLLTDWEDFTGDRESIGRNATRSALSAAHTPAGRSDAEMLAWVARRGVKIIPPALHIMGMWVIQADSGISLGTGLSPAAAIATAMNRETRPNA